MSLMREILHTFGVKEPKAQLYVLASHNDGPGKSLWFYKRNILVGSHNFFDLVILSVK